MFSRRFARAGPSRKAGFLQIIGNTIAKGIAVVITSQAVHGAVSLATYEVTRLPPRARLSGLSRSTVLLSVPWRAALQVGRALLNLGVIPAADMTVEACVAKLAYLCGRGLRGDRLKARRRWPRRTSLAQYLPSRTPPPPIRVSAA